MSWQKPSEIFSLRLIDIVTAVCILLSCILLNDFNFAQQKISDIQDDLNNTKYADQTGLIFNRNPKCGSESMWALLDKLAVRNNFTSYSDSSEVKEARGAENTYMWRTEERHDYIRLLSIDSKTNMSRPFSYVKHLNFLDLSELNYTNPIYVNFVRHPVERVISWYYYIRQATYLLKHNHEKNTTALHPKRIGVGGLKSPYEECVLNRREECIYEKYQRTHLSSENHGRGGSHFSQIGFFCGMGPECNVFGSEKALEVAKANVEKHYAVVGILEYLQMSLEVLEEFVPRYFRDARKVYREVLSDKPVNRNERKPKTSKAIKDLVAKNFTTEIEFYEFCKQRMFRQYLTIQKLPTFSWL